MVVIEDEKSDAKVGVRDLPENSREAGLLDENKARERKKQSSPDAQQEQMAQLLGSLLGGANIPKFHNEDMDDDEDEEEAEHVAKHYDIPEETEQELRAKSRRNLIVLVLIVLSGLAAMFKNGEDSPFAQVQSMLFGGGKSSRPRTAPAANHHKRETPEEEKKRKLQERMEKRRKEAYEREMQNLNKYSHSSPKAGEKMKSKKKKGKKGANSKNEKNAKSGSKANKPAPEKAEKEAKTLDAMEEMDRWRAQIEEELEL